MSYIKSGVANRYRLRFDDRDPVEVQSTVADVIRWERSHQGTPFMTGEAPSSTALMEVAFYACRRQGLVEEKNFDQFFPHVLDFDLDQDDEDNEPDPTRTGQSAGSSVD